MTLRSIRDVVLLPFFLLSPSFFTYSQIKWTQLVSSGGSDNTEHHAIYHGDVYACGIFEGTVSIGGEEFTSRGESDIFLYRTNASGTVEWATSIGGPNYDGDVGLGIDTDGNIYLAGGFVDELYLNNTLLLGAAPGNNYWNSFISKFDMNGNHVWTKGIVGTTALSEARIWGNITVGTNGFSVACNYSGDISVGGFPMSSVTTVGKLFVASFDFNGNLLWTKDPPGVTTCQKIKVDNSGSLYLTGPFTDSIRFDSYALTAKSSHYSDIYTVKLNSSGQALWLRGGIKSSARIDNNWPTSLAVDPMGNVYITGIFKGEVVFDQFTIYGNTDVDYSVTDSFLVKYNESGDVEMAVNFGESFNAFATDIVYSEFGLFVLGTSTNALQLFYSVVDSSNPAASAPLLLDGYGFPEAITIYNEQTVYISGYAGVIEGQVSNGVWDGFLIKIEPCIAATPSTPNIINGPQTLCSNEQISYSVDPIDNATQYVWDVPPIFLPSGTIYTTTNEISLKVSSNGEGNVLVYGINTCGQPGAFFQLPIVVPQSLAKPIINKNLCGHELAILKGENIEWYKNDQLIDDEATRTLSVLDSGIYKVKVSNFCSSAESDPVAIYPVDENGSYYIPNVVTPNGDMKNDFFCVDKSLVHSMVVIYNRWGEVVYMTNDYENSWGGDGVTAGMYYYYLQNSCLSKPYKGSIHVIK